MIYAIIFERIDLEDFGEGFVRKKTRQRGEFTLNDAPKITKLEHLSGIEASLKVNLKCEEVEIISILPLRTK